MGTLVITKESKCFDLDDVSEVLLLQKEMNVTGWYLFWIAFWTIIFFPIAFVVFYFMYDNKKYTAAVTFRKSKRVYTFDQKNWNLLDIKEIV
jgi:hypothetical protein